MGVRSIDETLCTGCGTCVAQCPMDVLRLVTAGERTRAIIQYLRDCQSCALCEAECPEGAIMVTPTFERRVVTAW
jgi:NAD-dependent dihydropyrimidine dehydrogenase PreA subunit